MRRVFKYLMPPGPGSHTILMPFGAQILRFAFEHDKAVFWAEVDRRNRSVSRTFVVIGTGEEVPRHKWNYLPYLGSYVVPSNPSESQKAFYIWHVYDRGESE